jgi:nitrite reductase/ring-hydroxylating ferredoxin subunit
MTDFLEVASVEQIAPGHSMVVTVAGKDVALFNVDGQIYAIDDACVHQGASLGSGKFQGKIVTCRAHGLKFDVTTGFVGGSPGYGVASHAVQIIDGKIAVAV